MKVSVLANIPRMSVMSVLLMWGLWTGLRGLENLNNPVLSELSA